MHNLAFRYLNNFNHHSHYLLSNFKKSQKSLVFSFQKWLNCCREMDINMSDRVRKQKHRDSPMSDLSLAWRDRFRSKPVIDRSSRSLLVRSRSISTGSMCSCSRATWLSTSAHCRKEGDNLGVTQTEFPAFTEPGGRAVYPLVSSCDVLQGSGSCLPCSGIDLTFVQHAVIQRHDLRVPQPLCALWHSRNFRESGQV